MANEDRAALDDAGVVRKAHYGDGKQPWDDMIELGWAHTFAAASILKYLRRTKDEEHSLQSSRWYYVRLKELSLLPTYAWRDSAMTVLTQLHVVLTPEELRKLK